MPTSSSKKKNAMDVDELVKELRKKLADTLDPSYDWDYNLQRWLVAYDNDIEQLLPILTSALEFRRNLALDKVKAGDVSYRDDFDKKIQDNYPGGLSGYDKQGNVIVIEPTGRCDPRGLMHVGRCSEFIKWRLFETEHVMQMIISQEKKLGKKCGLTMIMDLEGLTMDQIYMPTMHIYITIMVAIQRNYPEMLFKLLIIKPPAVMNVAYRIILPFLNKKTRDKLEFVSGDSWRPRLLELIDENQLPVHWGGSRKGVFDDFGDIRKGGKVSEDVKKGPVYTIPSDLISITVARGSANRIKFQLNSVSRIGWYFVCPVGDIDFGIDKVISDDQRRNILPHFRLNTEIVPEFGKLNELDPGDYEMVFDNTYSWLRTKTINYHLTIDPVE